MIPHVYGSQKLLVMMQSSDSSSGTDCVCPVGMARAGLDFPGPGMGWTTREYARGAFFFFILKKIKISKIYVRFENFRKYPRSPVGGRQDLNVNFF